MNVHENTAQVKVCRLSQFLVCAASLVSKTVTIRPSALLGTLSGIQCTLGSDQGRRCNRIGGLRQVLPCAAFGFALS